MKRIIYHEKTLHILTSVGFLLCALILLCFPSFFDTRTAIAALFFLLGTKTLANIIIDTHHEETYFRPEKNLPKK